MEGRFELLLSAPLVIEYEAVSTRPEHLAVIGLSEEEVKRNPLWRPRLKDAADEMVLETAVNGSADWLVTFNVRHLSHGAAECGVRVLRPGDAWKEIQKI